MAVIITLEDKNIDGSAQIIFRMDDREFLRLLAAAETELNCNVDMERTENELGNMRFKELEALKDKDIDSLVKQEKNRLDRIAYDIKLSRKVEGMRPAFEIACGIFADEDENLNLQPWQIADMDELDEDEDEDEDEAADDYEEDQGLPEVE